MTRELIPHSESDLTGLPRSGDILGEKYRIGGILGVGGMAVVLEATHLVLQEKVAIKMLLPVWADVPELVARFMHEGRAATSIRGEHVVRVLDVDRADGRPYLVLEYLAGADLEQIVAREGPQPVVVAVDYVLQACEALAEAHVAGIIHRDLKPANLFLCHRADGSPCIKVLDFGISKTLTKASRESVLGPLGTLPETVMGSPHYMSPEQMASAKNVDARSDIWSLGAILHELIAGKPPFEAGSITALCARILRDPPPPITHVRPEVPAGLEAIILRCLEKDAHLRFGSVAELARAIAVYGSPEAQLSAARATRIIEAAGQPCSHSPPASDPASSGNELTSSRPSRSQIRAIDILDGVPSPPMRPRSAAFMLLTVALLGGAGVVGWRMADAAGILPVELPFRAMFLPAAAPSPGSAPVPASRAPETTGGLVATHAVPATSPSSATPNVPGDASRGPTSHRVRHGSSPNPPVGTADDPSAATPPPDQLFNARE